MGRRRSRNALAVRGRIHVRSAETPSPSLLRLTDEGPSFIDSRTAHIATDLLAARRTVEEGRARTHSVKPTPHVEMDVVRLHRGYQLAL